MTTAWRLRKITHVRPTKRFELICTFDDQTVRIYDMKPALRFLGPMVEPLQKLSFFKRVLLEFGSPTWPNGFDVCADVIYEEGWCKKSTPGALPQNPVPQKTGAKNRCKKPVPKKPVPDTKERGIAHPAMLPEEVEVLGDTRT